MSPTDAVLDCAFCSTPLANLDVSARQEHYERHLAEDAAFSTSSSFQNNKRAPKARRVNQKSDMFWYRAQHTPPPSNYTPGLIHLLKKALWTSHAQGATRRAALCYEGSVHVSQELWDRGWGCGYRNFLMACTALMDQSFQPSYFPLLDAPITLGVRNIQALIENAWKDGFDEVGAKDLKNLVGSKKWIGTADLWVAFSYCGIPAELVDFDLKHQTHGVEPVLDWIVDYFSPKPATAKSANINDVLQGASPIVVTDRMPLILQHNGHSRTVVGYEISKAGKTNLLMFDPSMVANKDIRDAAICLHNLSLTPNSRHPADDPNSTRKRLSDGLSSPPSTKRIRREPLNGAHKGGDEDEVIVVSEACQERVKSYRQHGIAKRGNLRLDKVLTRFRLDGKQLRKNEYQILYFPMTTPLTSAEKIGRKVVTSTKAS